MSTTTTVLFIILLIVLFMFILLCYAVYPSKPTNEQMKPFYHRNFAHRGLHSKNKHVPENSLPAFSKAVSKNYGIELDLQFSKDFQVVVFHDNTLDRVCGIHGRVDEFNYSELRNFQLCGTKEHIPLFSDVLKIVDGKVPLIVELKSGPHNHKLCEAAYEMLKAYNGEYCIESFDPYIVRWFKQNAPHLLRGQLSAPYHTLLEELVPWKAFFLGNCLSNFLARPNFIAYDKTQKPWTVKLAEKLGAMPVVWTVRNTDDIKQLEASNNAIIFEFYEPTTRYD